MCTHMCGQACAHIAVCEHVHTRVCRVCAHVCGRECVHIAQCVGARVGLSPGSVAQEARRWAGPLRALGRWAPGWHWAGAGPGQRRAPTSPHSAPPGRPRAAEAQRGRDPNGGLCPLAWAGQPWASRSSSPCLINGGGVGPFSWTCPSPARPCLLSRWTPPSHFLPPPPTGRCPNIWSAFPVSRGAGAGSQGRQLRNSVGVALGL